MKTVHTMRMSAVYPCSCSANDVSICLVQEGHAGVYVGRRKMNDAKVGVNVSMGLLICICSVNMSTCLAISCCIIAPLACIHGP